MVITGDLFKLAHFKTLPPEQHLVVPIEAGTVGESGRYTSYWNAFLSFMSLLVAHGATLLV